MAATFQGVKLWSNCVIPFQPFYTHPARSSIEAAIAEIEANSRIRFVERGTEANYVEFICDPAQRNGSESTGMGTGRIKVNVREDGWWALHELCHVIGLVHEQNRTDSQTFIKTNFRTPNPVNVCGVTIPADPNGNVSLTDGNMCLQCSVSQQALLTAYDPYSVMQYAQDMGRIAGTDGPSMTLNADPEASLGAADRRRLSVLDVNGIRELYKDTTAPWGAVAWQVQTLPNGCPPLSWMAFGPGNVLWGVKASDGTVGSFKSAAWTSYSTVPFKTVAFNGEALWAVGTNNQVYRWQGGTQWQGYGRVNGWDLGMLAFLDGEPLCVGTEGNPACWDRTFTPQWITLNSTLGGMLTNCQALSPVPRAPTDLYFVDNLGALSFYDRVRRVSTPVTQTWSSSPKSTALTMLTPDRKGDLYCITAKGDIGKASMGLSSVQGDASVKTFVPRGELPE